KSTDGGGTWTNLSNVYTQGGTLHPDQHAGLVPASHPDWIYVGNDGGLYLSTDGGASFNSLNDTLVLAQANGVALHPTDPDDLMTGTQHNGNLRFTNSLAWSDRTAGDGGFNLISAPDPKEILAANFYAYMNYSNDGGDNFTDATSGKLMKQGSPAEPMAFY